MEKCWQIVEKLPIPVTVHENGDISVAPMLMTFERFQELGDNLNAETIASRLRSKATHGLNDITEKMIAFPTGVYNFHYDYTDGECEFYSPSMEDTENWLNLYEGIVKKI